MGCSPLKTNPLKSASREVKLNPRIISTMSRNPTINYSEFSMKGPKNPKKKCLKFDILQKNPKFALNTLDLSKTQLAHHSNKLLPVFIKLKALYSKFSSAYSYFCFKTHSCCIPKGKFSNSLNILMLSILNNDSIRIQIYQKSPFLQVFGQLNTKTLKAFQAWEDLELCMDLIQTCNTDEFKHQIKYMESVQKSFEEYSEFVLKPARYSKIAKILKSASKAFEEMTVQVSEFLKDSKIFFKNFKIAQKRNKKLLGQDIWTCKDIVHSLY